MAFGTTGNLALLFGGMVAVVSASEPATNLFKLYRYDNETPLVRTLSAKPPEFAVRPGESFDVHYDYFRRPGCVGRVEYRLEGQPDGWNHSSSFVIGQYGAGWPDGANMQAAHVRVPSEFPAGQYEFVFITRADTCRASGDFKASSKPIEGRSLPVKVTIKPKEPGQ